MTEDTTTETTEGAKLYVGNLPYSYTDADLLNLFAEYGATEGSAVIILNRDTGQSKGFGFVTLLLAEQAQKAIEELNGKEIDGRQIVVAIARPQEERPQRNRDFSRGGFSRNRY